MKSLFGTAASAAATAPRKVSEHLATGASVGAAVAQVGAKLFSEQVVSAGAAVGAQVAQLGTSLLSEAAGTAAAAQVAHLSATLECERDFQRARIDSLQQKIRVDLTHGPRDESRERSQLVSTDLCVADILLIRDYSNPIAKTVATLTGSFFSHVAYIYDVAGRDTGGRERTANDFNDPWILHSDAFGVSVQNASKMYMDRVDRDFDWAILRLTVPIDYTYAPLSESEGEGGARLWACGPQSPSTQRLRDATAAVLYLRMRLQPPFLSPTTPDGCAARNYLRDSLMAHVERSYDYAIMAKGGARKLMTIAADSLPAWAERSAKAVAASASQPYHAAVQPVLEKIEHVHQTGVAYHAILRAQLQEVLALPALSSQCGDAIVLERPSEFVCSGLVAYGLHEAITGELRARGHTVDGDERWAQFHPAFREVKRPHALPIEKATELLLCTEPSHFMLDDALVEWKWVCFGGKVAAVDSFGGAEALLREMRPAELLCPLRSTLQAAP